MTTHAPQQKSAQGTTQRGIGTDQQVISDPASRCAGRCRQTRTSPPEMQIYPFSDHPDAELARWAT